MFMTDKHGFGPHLDYMDFEEFVFPMYSKYIGDLFNKLKIIKVIYNGYNRENDLIIFINDLYDLTMYKNVDYISTITCVNDMREFIIGDVFELQKCDFKYYNFSNECKSGFYIAHPANMNFKRTSTFNRHLLKNKCKFSFNDLPVIKLENNGNLKDFLLEAKYYYSELYDNNVNSITTLDKVANINFNKNGDIDDIVLLNTISRINHLQHI